METPLLPPHEALSLSDLVHMALAWSPFSEPVEIDLFSHYVVLCDSSYLFHFSLLSGDPLLSALFSRYTKVMVLTADTHLRALSASPRCALRQCKGSRSWFSSQGYCLGPQTPEPLGRQDMLAQLGLAYLTFLGCGSPLYHLLTLTLSLDRNVEGMAAC